ncbi:hypothetical protein GO001_31110 [Streptomyces sp. NRRL B-1677]|uniref:Uncharacterized protein n=1 Tax=Streptomyces klenkii TaxID=1420899 RepID=A0A3B0BWX0_9ACTN|nr:MULTISPECIES: DUF6083 domain-containing protein [Streptomyces]MBF6049584.1 hypothetical protein [Streptomyces sp. NRRL B-1677]RKN77522.1 hypothetical protein D7231_02040 [Streptomyces klenkii]
MGVNSTPDAACPECGRIQKLRPKTTGGWIRLEPETVPAAEAKDETLRWSITADGYAVAGRGTGGKCYIEHRRVCSRRRHHPEHLGPIFVARWLRNRSLDGLPIEGITAEP